jgi:calcineurin-like phosphoesterase family protein
MMIYFTSDLHLFHKKAIEFDQRPFRDVDHMHQELVDRWNSVVKVSDVVYVLGDVSFGNKVETASVLLRCNGILHLIPGNHDNLNRLKPCFSEIHSWLINLNAAGRHFWLCHFPLDSWMENRGHSGGWINLHGHTHGTSVRRKNRLDVGCMNWNYTPISIDQVLEEVKTGS